MIYYLLFSLLDFITKHLCGPKNFGKNMEFQRFLVPYKFKDETLDEIESVVTNMKKVMDGNSIPKGNKSCQECAFIRAGSELILSEQKSS